HPQEARVSNRVPVHSVTANVHPELVARALDGDEDTRWESGPQTGAEVVTIELDASRLVDGVTMTIGSHASDFSRTLVVESSDDGNDWMTRWQGSSPAVAFAAAVGHPREMRLTF